MRKLEQIQLNKLISAYGGVGSIIETNTNGSLIILPYDQWICFVNVNQNPMEIRDNRLLSYVRTHGYPNVTRLVPIPDNDLSKSVYSATNANVGTTVSSKYFPEWYYCPHCRRLYKLSEWEFHWDNTFPNDHGFSINVPACCFCSRQINDDRISRYPLQQIRFVMASLSGDIEDVPFDRLWENNPNGGAWQVGNIMNAARNLRYRSRRGDGDGLQNLFIENADTNRRIYLSQIERNYIINKDKAYKMVVRGSQSLYFPEIVRSLYIPMEASDNINAQNTDELDLHEFRYLTNDDNFINNMIVNDDLVVRRRPELTMPFISRISAIEKLKETSVLLSYTRMGKFGEPRQWYNVGLQAESQGETAMSKCPFGDGSPKAAIMSTYMPAVESYGEGVLFEVNLNSIILKDDYETFVHTFCHIVMKEMEFQCGYPLTSLKEKIYIDNDNSKGGFLIYTIAGSEGSYGGLISLTQNGNIIELINRGAERARYCPNDPICSLEHEAHCFACLDLPETACIKFNAKLNRKLFLERWFTPRPNGLVL